MFCLDRSCASLDVKRSLPPVSVFALPSPKCGTEKIINCEFGGCVRSGLCLFMSMNVCVSVCVLKSEMVRPLSGPWVNCIIQNRDKRLNTRDLSDTA